QAPGTFFILHSSFFILHSQFFILHSQFFILHSPYLHSQTYLRNQSNRLPRGWTRCCGRF
ncbi:MAG TPA: hypothetical protein PKZ53_13800, partial [Acidobacteriota bacterium]|nr:hypothetical protein [Acidobacteriota bacterium]HNJ41561.1 hypothetical protein [Acidobacteriota bacterium]